MCIYIFYFRWVLLKNVHLAPQWLVQLEKKLHSLQPHTNFRLFLTMEINSAVPVNLLRAGRIFVFEPPPGVKANLLRTFNTVSIETFVYLWNENIDCSSDSDSGIAHDESA